MYFGLQNSYLQPFLTSKLVTKNQNLPLVYPAISLEQIWWLRKFVKFLLKIDHLGEKLRFKSEHAWISILPCGFCLWNLKKDYSSNHAISDFLVKVGIRVPRFNFQPCWLWMISLPALWLFFFAPF